MNAYQKLEKTFAANYRIEHALTILHWDEQTTMPPGGAEDRAQALSELGALLHERMCNAEIGQWLSEAQSLDLDAQQRANLNEISRHWHNETVLSEDFVREEILVASRCESQWRTQRQQNDWKGFCENFKPLVELTREKAKVRQKAFATATPYDALLGLYCHGDTSELINTVFGHLKDALPEMIRARRAMQDNMPQLEGHYAIDQQRELSHAVMKFLGFDFDRGRLDVSTHPFSTGNYGDQRITTRFNTEGFLEAIYATIHETGHARYEAGLPGAWHEQPVGRARNMSIHESQSLFFEKHIGASPAFCQFLANKANQLFDFKAPLSAEALRKCVTWVEPGLIRVNSDELTYPLHIVLRYEIESALINGNIEVDDVPSAWDECMQKYLGMSTQDDYKNGCMQDMHWPSGAFGYFPSYTLGAVNAAQLRQALEGEIGPIDDIIAAGDIEVINQWLASHIWQRACFSSSQELMLSATGKNTDAQSLIDHFQTHYLS